MKHGYLFSALGVCATALLLCSCSTRPVPSKPFGPGHAGIDYNLSTAKQGMEKVQSAVSSGQAHVAQAQRQAETIYQTASDPAIKQDLLQLKNTLDWTQNDLASTQRSLLSAQASLDTANTTLDWYEKQCDTAWKGWSEATDSLKIKTTEAHDNAVGRDFWLKLFAGIAAIASGRYVLKSPTTILAGPYGALVPVGAAASTGITTFFVGRWITHIVVEACHAIPLLDWLL
jgi:hypothetical protein